MGHLTIHALLSSNAFWTGAIAGFLATVLLMAVSLLILNWFDSKQGFAEGSAPRLPDAPTRRPTPSPEASPVHVWPRRRGAEL